MWSPRRLKQNNLENYTAPGETPKARAAAALASIAMREATARETTAPGMLWSPATPFHPDKRVAAASEKKGPAPEAIRQLEDSSFMARSKGQILLAALGKKPVSHFGLSSPVWHEGEAQATIPDDKYEEAVRTALDLGLHVHAMDRINSFTDTDGLPTHQTTRSLTVSHSDKLLTYVDEALAQRDDADQRILGEAFGYPATATEAYIQRNGTSAHRLGIDDPAILGFTGFILSPEHAQEELAVAHDWAQAVHDTSPVIYQQVVDSHYETQYA